MKSLGSIRKSFAPWNDPEAKAHITFDRVGKTFGEFIAVDTVSIDDIYEREFFALLGASGCEKKQPCCACLQDLRSPSYAPDIAGRREPAGHSALSPARST